MRSGIKFLFLVLIFFTSCVKDVDIDQFEEIVIPPSATIDLVYFDLGFGDFTDSSGSAKSAKDELRLEFLDDDYIQTGLKSAEFNVVFTNTLDQALIATFRFESESRDLQYSFSVPIPAGSEASPTIVNYTEIVPESEISKIKSSIWFVTEITSTGSVPTKGGLKLESKGLYNFEF